MPWTVSEVLEAHGPVSEDKIKELEELARNGNEDEREIAEDALHEIAENGFVDKKI